MSPRLAIGIAAISGAAALAHQLLWVRRLIDVLGADSATFSRVVAVFFLGLAFGSWWAAGRSTPRPWRSVALAEGAVAFLALLSMIAGRWVSLSGMPGSLAGWLLPVLLIAPPAVAMGMTLPWMIRGAGRPAAIYAANILGGIAGLLLTAAWALPAIGLDGASLLAAGISAGAAFLALRGRAMSWEAPAPAETSQSHWRLETLAFASGFLVLASEVIFQHQLSQFLVSSHLASAVVLAVVLAALGGAAIVAACLRPPFSEAITIALWLAGAACALQPALLVLQRQGVISIPFDQSMPAYLGQALALAAPAIGVVLLPAGLLFPLLLRRAADLRVDAGRLLALNGLGGWLGAELGQRLFFPLLGLWFAMAVIAAGYFLCATLAGGQRRWLALVSGAMLVWSGWNLNARLPWVGLAPQDRLVKVRTGREGVVSILRGDPGDWRLVMNNSYTLGGSRAAANQERQTLLPMLLHGDARRVVTLGVATGSSLAGATLDPALELAEGIDLSPLVLDAAREDFAPFNRGIGAHPKVRLTAGDARRVIAARPGAFDVIVGDLFLPWGTGEARLFTREHFEAVRRALRPRGIFCQWLPMYQLTEVEFRAIVRTFRAVFPDLWLVRGDFYLDMPIVGLVGGRSLDEIDWDAVTAACERVRAAGKCDDLLLRHPEGVAMCVVGPPPPPAIGPEVTLANGWLEWDAARNLIGLREPWFTGLPLARFFRDCQTRARPLLPGPLQPRLESADRAISLEVAATANLADRPEAEARFLDTLPAALAGDSGARLEAFPMRHPPAIWRTSRPLPEEER